MSSLEIVLSIETLQGIFVRCGVKRGGGKERVWGCSVVVKWENHQEGMSSCGIAVTAVR